jgi:cyanophycinase
MTVHDVFRFAVAPLFALFAAAAPALAQATVDSAAFIVRLGTDTVAVERWVRTAQGLDAVAVTRSPRTVVRRYSVRMDADGRVTHVAVGDAAERAIEPAGAIPITTGFYAPYALAVAQAARRGDAAVVVVPMLAGTNLIEAEVRRAADGEYSLPNQFGAPMQVRTDAEHRVLFVDAGGGTTVERVRWFDIDAYAQEFSARDARNAGLGPLSPRDTVRAEIAGAVIMVDYSRPSARGRTVMGGLVPYGALWRTGANDATQLIIDRVVQFGDISLQPGAYSLFTIPGADDWQLIINRGTGVSGLAHDPALDVARVTMAVRTPAAPVEQFTIQIVPAGAGGELRIQWGTAEAYVPFRVPAAEQAQHGRLVIVGGGLSRDTEAVYRAVLDGRAGDGPLCVIPTAGAEPESAITSTVAAFARYGGTAEGVLISTDNPEAADDARIADQLRRCSGFYFTGGVQSRIVSVFRPAGHSTPAHDAVMERFRNGAVVAGSSAGAAIMSDPMIAGGSTTLALARGVRRGDSGTDDDDEAGAGAVSVTTGLGFLPAIVDQHFLARGRIGRLITAVLDLGEFDVGFGIDENTALVVEGTSARPVGASGVVVIDARHAYRAGRSASGVDLHLLSAGDSYDMLSGRVTMAPDKQPPPAAAQQVALPDDIFARWSFLHLLHHFGTAAQTDVSMSVEGGELRLHRSAHFNAASRAGEGVQGTPSGLSVTGLKLDVRR